MPGGHGLALLRQQGDAALLGQEIPDLAAEHGIRVLRLLCFEHLAEDADQVLLRGPMLLVQLLKLLLGQGLGTPDATQHHLDQLIAAPQAEQEGVTLARLGDAQQVAHLRSGGFGRELAQLGVGDAIQQWIGIDQAVQPFEAVGPEPNRLGGRRPWRLLQPVETGHGAPERLDQQGIQRSRLLGRDAGSDAVVHAPMDFGAQPAHQPVKGAERRQVGCRRVQGFDRPVDEVGRVAHGFGGFEDGAGDKALGFVAIRLDAQIGPHRGLVAVE